MQLWCACQNCHVGCRALWMSLIDDIGSSPLGRECGGSPCTSTIWWLFDVMDHWFHFPSAPAYTLLSQHSSSRSPRQHYSHCTGSLPQLLHPTLCHQGRGYPPITKHLRWTLKYLYITFWLSIYLRMIRGTHF